MPNCIMPAHRISQSFESLPIQGDSLRSNCDIRSRTDRHRRISGKSADVVEAGCRQRNMDRTLPMIVDSVSGHRTSTMSRTPGLQGRPEIASSHTA